jgi:eukaryotic-like serine/threonine-protein kinase
MTHADPQYAAGVREGEILAGKYRVEKVLGVGGMGVVVAAHHVQLDEKVAVKFLLPAIAEHPDAVRRFLREARAAVKIKSEHVARVFDVGTLENGAPYFVMEHLEGGDLSAWLQQRGAMPVEQAVEFVIQACVAVADAHALGIVHRDLKPANLFCVRRSDGLLSIKVLDFGISKMTTPADEAGLSMTSTGSKMGSPYYMSPEQMRSSKTVDAGTDIWALGVILYELMTGAVPFKGESITDLAVVVTTQDPRPPRELRPEIPLDLESAVLRCLRKQRQHRYRHVGELALAILPFGPKRAKGSVERISGIIQSAGLSASALDVPPSPINAADARVPTGTLPPISRTTMGKSRLKPAFVRLGAAGGVVIVAGALALMWRRGPSTHNEAPLPSAAASLASSAALVTEPKTVAAIVEAPQPSTVSVEALPTAETATATDSPPTAPAISNKKTPTQPRHVIPSGVTGAASTPTAPTSSQAPPAPTCSIVTNYDREGLPHFVQVCK